MDCGGSAEDALEYASRLGLARILEERGIAHDLPAVGRRAPRARFVELQEFGGVQMADDLIDVIEERLVEWGDGYLAGVVRNQVYELGINIEEHAERRGFVMAQWFPNPNQLDIAVADSGVGIAGSLARAGLTYDSDALAIRAAVETRVTSKPKDGGFGLERVGIEDRAPLSGGLS